MFVTTEYLDLFDMDAYMNDNLSDFLSGETVVISNTQKYQDRLYATLIKKTITDEETGEAAEMPEFVFEGVPGFLFYLATIKDTGLDGEPYPYTISSISDGAISDAIISTDFSDDKTGTVLEGTIFVTPSYQNLTFFLNPVFQSADGRVYTVSEGGGFLVNNESFSEGAVYSQTLDNTTTATENGRTKTDSTSITLHISYMFAPEKIVILQMDVNSGLLMRMEYAPGAMPEAFTPEADTAYLIVETHKRDDTGSPVISRGVFGRDAENIESFFSRDDGICVKRLTEIRWR
jgi:hypothetical protein